MPPPTLDDLIGPEESHPRAALIKALGQGDHHAAQAAGLELLLNVYDGMVALQRCARIGNRIAIAIGGLLMVLAGTAIDLWLRG